MYSVQCTEKLDWSLESVLVEKLSHWKGIIGNE